MFFFFYFAYFKYTKNASFADDITQLIFCVRYTPQTAILYILCMRSHFNELDLIFFIRICFPLSLVLLLFSPTYFNE